MATAGVAELEVAPPPTGTVIYTHTALSSATAGATQPRSDEAPRTRFQDDRGAARAGAMKMQPVPTHVDQLTGHGVGAGVKGSTVRRANTGVHRDA
jgi:hypothetical protein